MKFSFINAFNLDKAKILLSSNQEFLPFHHFFSSTFTDKSPALGNIYFVGGKRFQFEQSKMLS